MEIRLPYTKSNWCVVVYTNSIFGLWEILHKTAGRKKVVEISSSKKKYAYITKQDGNTSYFAEFRTKNNEYYKSWMPDSLVKKYHKLGAVECFVWNNGKKPCSKNRTYYDTKLIAIQTAARE